MCKLFMELEFNWETHRETWQKEQFAECTKQTGRLQDSKQYSEAHMTASLQLHIALACLWTWPPPIKTGVKCASTDYMRLQT
jgi:hypothetical protein